MTRPRIIHVLASVLLAGIVLAGAAAPLLAGGDHDTGKLEHVVSLEGKSGLNLLMAKWYNENRLLYATVVTATMAVLGIVIGRVTEFALKLFGVK
jgi:hypothetical protein